MTREKKKSLLEWCKSITSGYENLNIESFQSESFLSGYTLVVILHSFLPQEFQNLDEFSVHTFHKNINKVNEVCE